MGVFNKNIIKQDIHPFPGLQDLIGLSQMLLVEDLFKKHSIEYWRDRPNTLAHEIFHIVSGGLTPEYYEYDNNDNNKMIPESAESFQKNMGMVCVVMKQIVPFINRIDGQYHLKLDVKGVQVSSNKYECVSYLDFTYFYYDEEEKELLSEEILLNTEYVPF
jgi:hypothetical protein